jgi:hypothetical protein
VPATRGLCLSRQCGRYTDACHDLALPAGCVDASKRDSSPAKPTVIHLIHIVHCDTKATQKVNNSQPNFPAGSRLTRSCLFSSHRLDEVLELADTVTVRRSRASDATAPHSNLNVYDSLAALLPPPAGELKCADV